MCLFHFAANVPVKLDKLDKSVLSELDGNPPIWITRKSPEEIYVNQAKIVYHLANYEHNNTQGKPQVSKKLVVTFAALCIDR